MKKIFTLTLFLVIVCFGVTTAQNVGIGTTTPTAKLEVVGKIKTDTLTTTKILIADTTRGAGKFLISDSLGNGSWHRFSGSDLAGALPPVPPPDYSCIHPVGLIPGIIKDIDLSGNYLYGLFNNSLKVYNVSNPAQAVLTASTNLGGAVTLTVSGNYAYVGYTNGFVLVYNVTNPALPFNVGAVGTGLSPVASIKVSGNYAYAIDMSPTFFRVLDISNPAAPSVVGSLALGFLIGGNPNFGDRLAISGNHAYVVNEFQNVMKVIDISNPTAPFVSASLTISSPLSLTISGNYAYVINNVAPTPSLQIINIQNPAAPVVTGTLPFPGSNLLAISLSGNYAVISDGQNAPSTLRYVDVSNPAAPALLTSFPTVGGGAVTLKQTANYVYAAGTELSGSPGIAIIDLRPCINMLSMDANGSLGTSNVLNGTSNYLVKFNGPTNGTSSGIYQSGNNIGIGTTSPNRLLDVRGDIAQGTWTDVIPNRRIGVMDAASTQVAGTEIENTTLGGNFSQKFHILTHHYGATFGRRLTIDEDGKVGIGTQTPSARLDIAGTLKITDGTQGAGKVLTADSTGLASWKTVAPEADPKVGSTIANQIPKWNGTALTDGLIFDNGTNIGIGTVAPAAKLDITGTIKITDGTQGIGKVLTSDANGLAAWQTESDPKIGSVTTNQIPKWNGTLLTDGLIFDNGINIGVGTITPTAKMDIAGTIKITDGTQGIGKVLTSDANGLAAWQTESDPKIGTVATNKIPKWNGTVLTDGMITDNGTYIGIGTTSPQRLLDIRGDIAQGTWTDNIPSRRIGVMSNTLQVAGMEIENTSPGGINYSQKLHLLTHRNGISTDRRLTIDEDGNVGIGTQTPANKLSVAGNASITGNLSTTGNINSPKFRVTEVWNNFQCVGGLPAAASFTTGGGTLMLSISAMAYSSVQGLLVIEIQIDGNPVASMTGFATETNSQKTLTSSFKVISGLAAGTHTIRLVAIPGTLVDANSFLSTSILELPF